MITSLIKTMNSVLAPAPMTSPQVMSRPTTEINPFASPFIAPQRVQAKNQPVPGGYFAGYYNGKKNIVGKRLFISV
ncbi:MAG: hypothetical protein GX568_09185 [Candidatus Gastranaerophilales bacterium]|nr:hypothetical protein [Candidatus Gastranaerophilales bacterium]